MEKIHVSSLFRISEDIEAIREIITPIPVFKISAEEALEIIEDLESRIGNLDKTIKTMRRIQEEVINK